MTEQMKQVGDPEQIHSEVLRLEDEIMPVLTKVKNALKLANKQASDEDCDAIERIEGLEYFKNESGYLMQWIETYMNLCEELRSHKLPVFAIDSKFAGESNIDLPFPNPPGDLDYVKTMLGRRLDRQREDINHLQYVNDQEKSREFSLLRDEFKEFHKVLKGDLKVKILKSDMSFKEWFKTRFLSKF